MITIGDRMKQYYEDAYRIKLPMRMPVIIRLDGRSFHTLTKGINKPYDDTFIQYMAFTGERLMKEVQNAVVAYIQSDEISLLLHNYKRLNTESWFDNNVQKMASVSAGIASSYFTYLLCGELATFDARVFVLPEAEVCNYFIWRQQDATRNSIQGYAQSMFSQKQLEGKNCGELQNMMLIEHDFNWDNVDTHKKRGYCIYDNKTDFEPPIFTENREYIENHLITLE